MVTADEVKLLVFVAEICQPGGGVRVTFVVRLDPLSVKVWLVEFVPSNVVKPESAVLLVGNRFGAVGSLTVPVTELVRVVAPGLAAVTKLVKVPAFVPVRRT
jgi:hypothetical protein